MEKVSKHISYSEATRSNTATRWNIDNIPNGEQLDSMRTVAWAVFEPLRVWVDGPIRINSFFRSQELNTKLKGSRTSSHMKGQAIDIDDTHGHATNAEMFNRIKDELDFDQLIWEFGDDDNPAWVHVSYISPYDNRNQVLKAIRFTDRGGKKRTKYIPYE